MTVSALSIKVLSGSVFCSSVVVGSLYLISPEIFQTKKSVISGDAFLVASTGASVSTQQFYKCQIFNTTDFDDGCKVELVKPIGNKNTVDLSQLQASDNLMEVNVNNNFEANKLYKVVAKQDFIDKAKSDTSKKIQIVEKNKGNLLTELNVLFASDANLSNISGTTKHFLGQAKTFTQTGGSGSVSTHSVSENVFKCVLDNTTNHESSNNCKIYDFSTPSGTAESSSKFNSQTFTKTTELAKKIDQYKFYLIEFTESGQEKEISESKSKNILSAHVLQAGGSNVVSSGVNKIEFEHVAPVIITNESPSRSLVLTTTPT